MPPSDDILSRIHNLELAARSIAEGYLAGRHRSARQGVAVEFAQHREYAPGDDIKHLDWKIFGRTDRLYLKQQELETDLVAYLIVDASESMRFRSGDHSKYEVARLAGLALAHLATGQGDGVGLARFDSEVREFLRPASTQSQIHEMTRVLVEGPSAETTAVGTVLGRLAEQLPRRGVCLVFSDFFDEPAEILEGLRHLKYARHDVTLFHVLDPAEVEFPFTGPTLFRGLEQLPELLTDPRGVRAGYLEEFAAFRKELSDGCRALEVDPRDVAGGRGYWVEPRRVSQRPEGLNKPKMKILLTIPHYHAGSQTAGMPTLNATGLHQMQALVGCYMSPWWSLNRSPFQVRITPARAEQISLASGHEVHVKIVTTGDNHLLGQLQPLPGHVSHYSTNAEPSQLGFECHSALRAGLGDYDYYGYVEDDLLMRDPWVLFQIGLVQPQGRAGMSTDAEPVRIGRPPGRQ